MQARSSKASAIVVQRVAPTAVNQFMDWQKGVTEAAEAFPGYQGTDVYPAAPGESEWVVIVHFTDAESLQRWLDSPIRAQWLQKLRAEIGDFTLKAYPAGFSFWFADLSRNAGGPPPHWKAALVVLVALYPTVMLLSIVIGPWIAPWGLAAAMLVSNMCSVSILEWIEMPVLSLLLRRWLKADLKQDPVVLLGGSFLLLAVLIASMLIFQQVTG